MMRPSEGVILHTHTLLRHAPTWHFKDRGHAEGKDEMQVSLKDDGGGDGTKRQIGTEASAGGVPQRQANPRYPGAAEAARGSNRIS